MITRVQKCIQIGLELLAKRHLILKGVEESYIKDLQILLPDPSDLFAKRRLELENIKAAVTMAVIQTGLFPNSYIYKNFYDMSDGEVSDLEAQLEDQKKKQAEQQMTGAPGGGAGVGPGTGVAPPLGGTALGATPPEGAPTEGVEPSDGMAIIEKIKKYKMLIREYELKE